MYDVIIIGAGVTGSAIARELSKWQLRIAVLEKASDVCEGTSKANSGIVHGGFDAKPGSLKAKFNVLGNKMMEKLSQDLEFPFKRNGSLVLTFDEEGKDRLEELKKQGEENGVEGLCILNREQLKQLEPHISDEAKAALYAPTGGIVCPFHLTMALAENAAENGVEFFLNTKVENLVKTENGYKIETDKGSYETKTVVNAAGVYADVIHNMVSGKKMKIVARKGEYCLMDKEAGNYVSHTIFQLPGVYGKGVLVTPTVHGNLLAGPTAEDIEDKEGIDTTAQGMETLLAKGGKSVENLPTRQIITSFAGLRAHMADFGGEEDDDFVIGEAEDAPGFFDAAGIESPGLSSAPAIGEYVAEWIAARLSAKEKPDFKEKRKGMPNMAEADEEERKRLIAEDPAFANVICRCELVTEGEILAAIRRTLGATTLDGIKRRTRAGMGRCQAGFCSPKTVEILAEELGKDIGEITKTGGESRLLTGMNKA